MIREYIYFVDDNPNGTSGMTKEEIIRCKDCRWWASGENESESWEVCMRDFGKSFSIGADGYCSRGERIEDD